MFTVFFVPEVFLYATSGNFLVLPVLVTTNTSCVAGLVIMLPAAAEDGVADGFRVAESFCVAAGFLEAFGFCVLAGFGVYAAGGVGLADGAGVGDVSGTLDGTGSADVSGLLDGPGVTGASGFPDDSGFPYAFGLAVGVGVVSAAVTVTGMFTVVPLQLAVTSVDNDLVCICPLLRKKQRNLPLLLRRTRKRQTRPTLRSLPRKPARQ